MPNNCQKRTLPFGVLNCLRNYGNGYVFLFNILTPGSNTLELVDMTLVILPQLYLNHYLKPAVNLAAFHSCKECSAVIVLGRTSLSSFVIPLLL